MNMIMNIKYICLMAILCAMFEFNEGYVPLAFRQLAIDSAPTPFESKDLFTIGTVKFTGKTILDLAIVLKNESAFIAGKTSAMELANSVTDTHKKPVIIQLPLKFQCFTFQISVTNTTYFTIMAAAPVQLLEALSKIKGQGDAKLTEAKEKFYVIKHLFDKCDILSRFNKAINDLDATQRATVEKFAAVVKPLFDMVSNFDTNFLGIEMTFEDATNDGVPLTDVKLLGGEVVPPTLDVTKSDGKNAAGQVPTVHLATLAVVIAAL